jgi:hypothetical protein
LFALLANPLGNAPSVDLTAGGAVEFEFQYNTCAPGDEGCNDFGERGRKRDVDDAPTDTISVDVTDLITPVCAPLSWVALVKLNVNPGSFYSF